MIKESWNPIGPEAYLAKPNQEWALDATVPR